MSFYSCIDKGSMIASIGLIFTRRKESRALCTQRKVEHRWIHSLCVPEIEFKRLLTQDEVVQIRHTASNGKSASNVVLDWFSRLTGTPVSEALFDFWAPSTGRSFFALVPGRDTYLGHAPVVQQALEGAVGDCPARSECWSQSEFPQAAILGSSF
jgi:hypothetical protein